MSQPEKLPKLPRYTDYCTCFYVAEEKKVYFYDEITDKPIKRQAVSSEHMAHTLMKMWKRQAPKNIICDILN